MIIFIFKIVAISRFDSLPHICSSVKSEPQRPFQRKLKYFKQMPFAGPPSFALVSTTGSLF